MELSVPGGAAYAYTQRKDGASIGMTAFRKFFFVGSDLFDRMPLIFDAIEPQKVEVGEVLIHKGEEGDKMYVIMSGILDVMQDDEETVKVQVSVMKSVWLAIGAPC